MGTKQFDLHHRLLIRQLEDARSEEDKDVMINKINEIIKILQTSLED